MLKKISVKHLTVGMYLKEFCGSWMEHPFWRNSFVITDPKLAALSQSIGGSGSAGEGTEAGDGESTEEPTPEATPTPPSDVETPSARG